MTTKSQTSDNNIEPAHWYHHMVIYKIQMTQL